MTSATELFPVLTSLGFNVKAGVELCGGDDAFYCELIQELHTDVLVRRNTVLRGSDAAARREYAHMLKGTLQVLGETKASQTARDLELAMRESRPSAELTEKLAGELDLINAALAGIFGGSPAA